MTDEELLESAAKAAGLKGFIRHWNDGPSFIIPGDNPVKWNPLTDDGDALRLAVKLNFGVKVNGPTDWQNPTSTIILFDGPVCGHRLKQEHDGDSAAATRRAIVRAAAEIGVSVNTIQPSETEIS